VKSTANKIKIYIFLCSR